MTSLYEIREQMKLLYSKYNLYIDTLLKFVLGLIVFFMVNMRLGYLSMLNNFAVPVLLALLCSFLPVNFMVVAAAALVIGHLLALSLEVGAVAAAILLVMLFLYFVVAPGQGYLLLVTPVLFVLRIPYALPLVMGLVGTPVCAVPIGCGVAAYYIMHFARENVASLSSAGSGNMGDRMKYMLEYLTGNQEMFLTICAFAAVLAIVYLIRRASLDYSWQIAIGAGCLANILIFLIGDFAMDVSGSILGLLLGSVLSAGAAFAVQFFVFSVDYTGTRKVQFEDDEYYYYVKAVPKITISVQDKQVKEIHRQSRRPRGQAGQRRPGQERRTHREEARQAPRRQERP